MQLHLAGNLRCKCPDWSVCCRQATASTEPLQQYDTEHSSQSPQQLSFTRAQPAETATTEDTEAAADRIAKHAVRAMLGDSCITSSLDLRESHALRESTASCTSRFRRVRCFASILRHARLHAKPCTSVNEHVVAALAGQDESYSCMLVAMAQTPGDRSQQPLVHRLMSVCTMCLLIVISILNADNVILNQTLPCRDCRLQLVNNEIALCKWGYDYVSLVAGGLNHQPCCISCRPNVRPRMGQEVAQSCSWQSRTQSSVTRKELTQLSRTDRHGDLWQVGVVDCGHWQLSKPRLHLQSCD